MKILLTVLALLLSASALALSFTDAKGRLVEIEDPRRVVSLYDSYGDAWVSAGGELAGAAEAESGRSVGSHALPNLELLLTLEPDFVLLSADVSAQAETGAWLDSAGIPCAYFSTKDYRAYMEMMGLFTRLTGREDLLAAQIDAVQKPIEAMISAAQALPRCDQRTALLLRAFSGGVKAKGSDGTVAGHILRDLGFVNIADDESPLSENLGMEAILLADPDYIFLTTMGESDEAAMEAMARLLTDNPAWVGLRAVREGRYIVLDPDLFHRHPNERWAAAYETIFKLIAEET